jgi:hypothetical protein
LKISIFPALLLALAPAAYADSITLNSAGGTSTFTSGTLQFLGVAPLNADFPGNMYNSLVAPTSPTITSGCIGGACGAGGLLITPGESYSVDPEGVWASVIQGSHWVTNSPDAGPAGPDSGTDGTVVDPNAFYYYQTTFTAVGGATPYDGSISVMADDTAEVLLNGTVIVPFGIVGNDGHCSQYEPSCGAVDQVLLSDITLNAGTNTLTIIDAQTGGYGAGVDFSATLTETPEPGSLPLLGAGLLGLAFVALQETKHLGTVLHS